MAGEAELVGDREAIWNGSAGRRPRWRPSWRWVVVPTRYRKLVAGVVALLGLSAAIGDALTAQATQRAADHSAVSVVDAAFSPSEDDGGLNLLIDITDTGQSPVTVTQAKVQQPDLPMGYLGAPIVLSSHQQITLVLWGRYDCFSPGPGASGSGPKPPSSGASTVRLTVRSSQGNVDTLDVSLPVTAQLPAPWRYGRTTYCALASGG
ncbi:MAG TPA: hypothetical protein VGS97_23935 [Actinocrinis sp.]|nr:hypothetical protein [Actinocrinis sp.]